METSVTFPGLPAIVPSARRFVRGILAGSPRADDMELACPYVEKLERDENGGPSAWETTTSVVS